MVLPASSSMALLGEPTRLEILRLVWNQEMSAGSIAERFPITFGAVSQHLTRLHDAGLIRRRREGRKLFYTAERERLGPFAAALEQMWLSSIGNLKELAEAEERGEPRTRRPAQGRRGVERERRRSSGR